MQTTLKIFSIIAVVFGSLAIITSMEGGTDAGYSFLGGIMFLNQGILSLVYIGQQNKK